jgi:hypothetical protein
MTDLDPTAAGSADGGELVADRYRLEREVGRGGMGAVYLGYDTVLHRQVALKQIGMMPGADEADSARVRREARVSAMLNHENVVAVFDLVETPRANWLVMEYLESRNLAQRIKRDGALTPDEAAALIAQGAAALSAAHRSGIIHRDVKPSNMLVTDDGLLKLGDFGIARAKSDVTLTQTGIVTGSPSYLAPEVAAGQGATTASDMWSLGATLYHVVTGDPPYDASENLMGTLYRIVHDEPPRTPAAGWLDPVLRATMHRDPEQRWTADQVLAFLTRGPGSALPPSDGPGTQVLPTVPPPEPERTGDGGDGGDGGGDRTRQVAAVAAADDRPRRDRRTPVVIAAAIALVAVIALGGWLLASGDEDTANPAAQGTGSTTTKTPPPAQATAAGMKDFIGQYLDTVTRDPATTWEQLTPAFQQASGGFGSYTGYWETIASATPRQVQADPGAMVVSYSVDYVKRDGSKVSDDVTLELVFRDGRYLIEGER